MKKHICLLCLLAAILCSATANAQFRYGPALGVNFNNLKFTQHLFTVDRTVGVKAGLATELMFPGIGFGINSGIFYEMRGAKLHLGEREVWHSLGYGNETSMLHYISIPINLRFKWTRMNGLEDYFAPFIYGGPVFSILAGHSQVKALRYSRGDVALTAGLGFELWKNWQVQAGYTWGVTTALQTRLLDDFTAKNRGWNLTFIYYLPR